MLLSLEVYCISGVFCSLKVVWRVGFMCERQFSQDLVRGYVNKLIDYIAYSLKE